MPKQMNVQVTTMDAVLEFSIESKATGKQLFDLVIRTLGLREVWYFGLQYTDVKQFSTWLRHDKKMEDQRLPQSGTVSFKFRSKFYPEDVSDLVMDMTRHIYYQQAKEDILNANIQCSPEASVLLASYALQAEYGDYEEDSHQRGFLSDQRLLPQNVIDQFDLTTDQWEDRIVDWWGRYKGILREEAEIEYLKIAQDLDMYGVNYFEITNKKGTLLWLGVDAFGLNIYNHENKLSPKISFPWGEIRNVEYHGKKFCIMPQDKGSPDFVFYVSKTKVSDLIMQLCVGNHDLFLKRRKVDTMEVQQMKAQAKEERARKKAEREKLDREKQARLESEEQKLKLEERVRLLEEQVRRAHQDKLAAERDAQILAERVKMAEEQTHTLTRKKLETEEEIRRVRASAVKSEEEKLAMERTVMKVKEQAANLLKTSKQREMEADGLRKELERAKVVEHMMRGQQVPGRQDQPTSPQPISIKNDMPVLGVSLQDTNLPVNSTMEEDMENLKYQLHKENQEYIEHSKIFSEQLVALQNKMDDLRLHVSDDDIDDKEEEEEEEEEVGKEQGIEYERLDLQALSYGDRKLLGEQLHASVFRQSSHKYSVLEKSKSGSTKSRIAFFEEL